MKKSVIYLGLALVAFGSVSVASNHKPSVNDQVEFSTYFVSPLNIAVSKGDIESVKKFIEYGADVNQMSDDMTPLMIAARYNKVEIMKVLLANGAVATIKNEQNFTALKYAELSKANDAIALLKSLK